MVFPIYYRVTCTCPPTSHYYSGHSTPNYTDSDNHTIQLRLIPRIDSPLPLPPSAYHLPNQLYPAYLHLFAAFPPALPILTKRESCRLRNSRSVLPGLANGTYMCCLSFDYA